MTLLKEIIYDRIFDINKKHGKGNPMLKLKSFIISFFLFVYCMLSYESGWPDDSGQIDLTVTLINADESDIPLRKKYVPMKTVSKEGNFAGVALNYEETRFIPFVTYKYESGSHNFSPLPMGSFNPRQKTERFQPEILRQGKQWGFSVKGIQTNLPSLGHYSLSYIEIETTEKDHTILSFINAKSPKTELKNQTMDQTYPEEDFSSGILTVERYPHLPGFADFLEMKKIPLGVKAIHLVLRLEKFIPCGFGLQKQWDPENKVMLAPQKLTNVIIKEDVPTSIVFSYIDSSSYAPTVTAFAVEEDFYLQIVKAEKVPVVTRNQWESLEKNRIQGLDVSIENQKKDNSGKSDITLILKKRVALPSPLQLVVGVYQKGSPRVGFCNRPIIWESKI